MGFYTRESLERLRSSVNLLDLVSSHVEMKRSGATYKGCCPFHDEKTPSFIIRSSDTHYHCFGCGAHGDAIQFLMTYLSMSFTEAVESLAERFRVHLECEAGESRGTNVTVLRDALEVVGKVYSYCLLHTDEGHEALQYLYCRGLTLEFIKRFCLGLAPTKRGVVRKICHKKGISDEILLQAGVLKEDSVGRKRDFFSERIMFPIHSPAGAVIGFSARKYKEDTFGGKYINSPETLLFKKSKVLYGLNYCRRRIAKDRKAIVTEGQVDALQCIYAGLDCTVAPLGTALGEGHVMALKHLGVNTVYLAFDGDIAGREATSKSGDMFQSKGIEVYVVPMPEGFDVDTLLAAQGVDGMRAALNKSSDYLTFLTKYVGTRHDMSSPAVKSEVVSNIAGSIRSWEDPIMVHESLRKLAFLCKVPEDLVDRGRISPAAFMRRLSIDGGQVVDSDRILEGDLIRWLMLAGDANKDVVAMIRRNITTNDFVVAVCKEIFSAYMASYDVEGPCNMLDIAITLESPEAQEFLSEVAKKKVNYLRIEEQSRETVERILKRNWLAKREAVKAKIHSGECSDDEVMALVKQFDDINRNVPAFT